MNALQTQAKQLPDNLEDLSKFVLVGREKLNAVRAEIRAIEKVQLAAEVHEQKLQEAQEIAEAVLDAETKLGELTSKMEKAVNQHSAIRNGAKSKKEQLEEVGINKDQASRFETLAMHPETVERAKADARAEGRIVTRQDVLNRIVPPKSQKQTMSEFKQRAHAEHEEFKQAKQEAVVSFEDIQKDKQNQAVVVLDTKQTIMKAIRTVTDLQLLKAEDIKEAVESMNSLDRITMINSLRNAIKTLVHISNYIGD